MSNRGRTQLVFLFVAWWSITSGTVAAQTWRDGLFALIAEEEAKIRTDPVARTTDLLGRIFGSLNRYPSGTYR